MLKQFLINASLVLAGFSLTWSYLPAELSAQQPDTNWIDKELEQARGGLDPDRLPSLTDTEAAVLDAMGACRAYLDRRATEANAAAWLDYLQLEPLADAIHDDESIAQRGHAAVELESRLRDVHPGLELKSMTSLRGAVQRYIAALRYSDPERGLASARKQLDALAEIFSSAPAAPDTGETDADETDAPATQDGVSPIPSARRPHELSPEEVAQVDQLLSGLADANQAVSLIDKIQSYYRHGNIRGWVDGQSISEAISRPVNNPSAVNDCILGTRMIGQARVDGNVVAQLLPSDNDVRLLIRMNGVFSTTARGYHKPITLDTTGSGRVYAARQIAITEKSIVLGETVSTAELSTQINRINHPLRIVRRIASEQAAEQRPLAEAISREKLRTQVHAQFDAQTAEMAGRSFPSLDSTIDPWLNRLDFPALTRSIGSTTDTVYARASLQRPHGLAAPAEPPALASLWSSTPGGVLPGTYLAAVQVHQSIVDNSIAQLLAGQTFTPDRILQLAQTLDIELPNRESLAESTGSDVHQDTDSDEMIDEQEQEQEDYEVDLANFRPVFVEADNQELRVGLRGTRFAQGGRELERTLEVSAIYRPVRGEDGSLWLSREDDVRLSFPGSRRLTISQTAIKTNMQQSFNKLFPKELLHRDFSFPADAKIAALAGRVVRISAIDLTDGWISIAVR